MITLLLIVQQVGFCESTEKEPTFDTASWTKMHVLSRPVPTPERHWDRPPEPAPCWAQDSGRRLNDFPLRGSDSQARGCWRWRFGTDEKAARALVLGTGPDRW